MYNSKHKFKYPHLAALFAVCVLSVLLSTLIQQPSTGLLLIGLWQLSQIAMSPRRSTCSIRALTDDQISEFEDICRAMKPHSETLRTLPARLKRLEQDGDELRGKLIKMNRLSAGSIGSSGLSWVGNVPFVTAECAEGLTATMVLLLSGLENGLERMVPDSSTRQRVLDKSRSVLGVQTRAALDPTSTPLPTIYAPQIVELVWKYGQARQFATVFPLGAGTVKLPQLQAGEDDFGYIGIGTAGMSQAVPERKVSADLVTFTANKAGGLIRIPTEIEEDTFIALGQFLARYIARQLAKLEDKSLFLGDGTSTFANITGIGTYCVNNAAYLQQLASTKTKPTDAQLSDFRALRGKVNAAVYSDEPAYYMNPTMEALLVTFNTLGSPLIYRPASGGQPATLDGFPIRWCGILQPYSTTAAASKFLAFFGALNYWYLGERGVPRIEISRDVFFATDELAMRALERIDVEAMGVDAMSALQTAAS